MAYIKVDTDALGDSVKKLSKLQARIDNVQQRLSTLSGQIDWEIKGREELENRINQLKSKIGSISADIGNTAYCLEQVSNEYITAQNDAQKEGENLPDKILTRKYYITHDNYNDAEQMLNDPNIPDNVKEQIHSALKSKIIIDKNKVVLPDDFKSYTIEKKVQFYLVNMGFIIGYTENGEPDIDGDWKNKSIAACFVFQNSCGIDTTGKPDEKTLKKLTELAESGKKYDDIFIKFDPSKHPITELPDNKNGHLSETELNEMIEIYTPGGGITRMQESEAIAWAYLVNAAATETNLDVERFYPVSGYRKYKDQVRLYAGYYLKLDGFNRASEPYFDIGIKDAPKFISDNKENFVKNNNFFDDYTGMSGEYDGTIEKCLSGHGGSNHGNGVALDLDTQDQGDKGGGKGVATTEQVIWLEKNAERFGFKPYLNANKSKIENDKKELVNNYAETWHWNYKP